ncbi:phosphogluconate dehydrogenase C-terminal domain-containing protein [Rhodobacter calidifons]|uniref:NAD(P)-binding domain-containing protein n=1 Tax=Rhodobacter calidifons TaxID=2715277 RepID=A0ABX0G3F1_9RHOB|nr:phosphogluconate dehydrogenase C-terminal domain-containing protein [Rhodobacter calidifons]NHB75391.1 NAD(P)-binding domain-containing protein [Rhodobacter calidifons]
MTRPVAVLGAGGKMGFRVTKKLFDAGYDLRAVEIGEVGRARLADAGITATDAAHGLPGAEVVVLALPDNIIGRVAAEIAPSLPAGTMLLILDAAAPYADVLPKDRPDLTYFVGHPCHPPLYNDESDWEARRDYHGGVAKQAIVCALMQGPEEHYALGVEICEAMWSPVTRTHRVSVEQLAILEPGLSEMVAMCMIDAMTEAVEECATRYGIDREAAKDFLIGHLNVEIAMWFGYSPKVPSDAALRLLEFGKSRIMRPDWREALSPKVVRQAADLIVHGKI